MGNSEPLKVPQRVEGRVSVSVVTVILYLFTTFKEVLEKLLNSENERDKN